MPTIPKSATLNRLLLAKDLSDNKQFDEKNSVLRSIIQAHPDEFDIDSVQDTTVGVTHTPTGFRIHMRKDAYPNPVKIKAFQAGYLQKAAAEQPLSLEAHTAKRNAYIRKLLRNSEGFRETLYNDPKSIPTIGTGINIAAQGDALQGYLGKPRYQEIMKGSPITEKEDWGYVMNHVSKKAIPALQKKIPTWNTLKPQVQAALVSLHYNNPALVGPNLRKHIADNNWKAAVGEVAYGHKGELPGLLKRRIQEAQEIARATGVPDSLKEVPRESLYATYQQYMKQSTGKP